MEDLKIYENMSYTNIVKELKNLPDTFENQYDKDEVWYTKETHITDLESDILRVYQTFKAINDIKVIDSDLARKCERNHHFVYDIKRAIELIWARAYEDKWGPELYRSKWNTMDMKKLWRRKFEQAYKHLYLVCLNYKKNPESPRAYTWKWLLDWDSELYDRVMERSSKKKTFSKAKF